MTQFEIRVAVPSDAEILLELIRNYFAFDHIRFDESPVWAGLNLLLRTPSLGQAWIVSYQGAVAGYFLTTHGFDLEFGGRQTTLTDLYIVPTLRGMGAGLRCLDTLEVFCRQAGIRAIELQVERDNVEAHSLYLKAGFLDHDRVPMSKRIE